MTAKVLPFKRPLVHNHGTEQGPGLGCKETVIDGQLVGECLKDGPHCHWCFEPMPHGYPGKFCSPRCAAEKYGITDALADYRRAKDGEL